MLDQSMSIENAPSTSSTREPVVLCFGDGYERTVVIGDFERRVDEGVATSIFGQLATFFDQGETDTAWIDFHGEWRRLRFDQCVQLYRYMEEIVQKAFDDWELEQVKH